MDPTTLAAVAVSLVTHYLIRSGKEAAEGAASEAGRYLWVWIKGKLTTPAGAEAVADAEHDPQDVANAQFLQAALTKALKTDADACMALEGMIAKTGASVSAQSVNVIGDYNKVGQASSGSTVTIR